MLILQNMGETTEKLLNISFDFVNEPPSVTSPSLLSPLPLEHQKLNKPPEGYSFYGNGHWKVTQTAMSNSLQKM